ncbi:transcriptional regulator, MarR family [Legionella lansingensis]|uniref:Transcriptional regulator, MarR family n=1 Tax=Legionella lansingensis TaxID=45067 RepID=A0A0W0VV56_9GAMM|nr:MarR family transcriptional regulator [Legionella lansingensis]KTD23877.1 transcriptional regulator, MarR family [Legionella lansingensis]SNV46527.1 transcriptional regulator, MarR family [Legionella lansingensis]
MSNTDKTQIEEKKSSDVQSEQRSKKIVLALRKIMQHMDFHSRRLNKTYGLTIPQIICLYEIYENGAITISSLSKRVYLSMSTLVGIIDRLEEKTFVNRVRDSKDRRIIFIDITEKGREFVFASPYLLHNRLNENLQALSEEEQIVLANSVNLLVNLLKDL